MGHTRKSHQASPSRHRTIDYQNSGLKESKEEVGDSKYLKRLNTFQNSRVVSKLGSKRKKIAKLKSFESERDEEGEAQNRESASSSSDGPPRRTNTGGSLGGKLRDGKESIINIRIKKNEREEIGSP